LIESWKASDAKGTVEASTGFGKTFIALLLIEEMNIRHPDRNTMVVVPTLYLKSQWEEELKKYALKNTEIFVINSAVKQSRSCDFLILDEIHRYGATVFGTVFQKISYEFILGLTATMERQDKRHYYILEYCPVIASVPIKESLAKKFVSDFVIYNLGIDLDESETLEYSKINKNFTRYFAWFEHNFQIAMRCMQDSTFIRSYARQTGQDEKFMYVNAVNFFRTMQARKSFLYDVESKRTKAVEIIRQLKLRTIVFCESIAIATEIATLLGSSCVTYHSRMGKKKQSEAMEKFKDSESGVTVISTVRSLDEGLNVENVECAIIISGNSTSRQSIQRTGRAIRYIEDKKAIIINIYINGTQEYKWVQGRMAGMPRSVIHWIQDSNLIDYEYRGHEISVTAPDVSGVENDPGTSETAAEGDLSYGLQ